MRIGSFSNSFLTNINQDKKSSNKINKDNYQTYQNNYQQSNFSSNSIYFTGDSDIQTKRKYSKVSRLFTPETKEVLNLAKEIAKKANSRQVESWHIYTASLLKVRTFLKELYDDENNYEISKRFKTITEIESMFGPQNSDSVINIFDKKGNVKKALVVVNKHLKEIDKIFAKDQMLPKRSYPFGIPLSQEAMNYINEAHDILINKSDSGLFLDSFLYAGIYNSKNKRLVKEMLSFEYDLKKAIIVEENKKDKNHLEFYNNKADIIWKNIDAGKNVAVLCDLKNYSQLTHLKSSFVNLINMPGLTFKNINPAKTRVITLNDLADMSLITDLFKECRQRKDETTVIFVDLINILRNTGQNFSKKFLAAIENNSKENSNIKLVLTMNPETYYINTEEDSVLSKGLRNYACQTISSLNAQETIKYLTNENGINFIKDTIKKDVSPKAIIKAIELSAAQEANYPDKAINLLKSAALFHSQEDKITSELVESYIQKTKNLSETQRLNSDSGIIFNTQKTLADIVGTPMTKADAQNIVSQIKRGVFKTKGYTIYQSNGTGQRILIN